MNINNPKECPKCGEVFHTLYEAWAHRKTPNPMSKCRSTTQLKNLGWYSIPVSENRHMWIDPTHNALADELES